MSSPESPPHPINHNHLARKITMKILPVGLIPVILLGVLVFSFLQSGDPQSNAAFSRLAGGLLVVTALISCLGSWYAARKISAPLSRISQAMESFTAGNWDQRAAFTSKDDMGRLAELFNQIADEYRSTYQSLTLREAGGRVGADQGLGQIAWIAVQSRSQPELLEGLLETLVRGFGLSYAAVYRIEFDLLREKRSAVRLHSYQLPGFDAAAQHQIERPDRVDLEILPTLNWQVSKAIATRQAQVAESDHVVGLFEAAVPLLRVGRIVGALELLAFSRSGDPRLGPFGARGLVELQNAAALIALALSDFEPIEAASDDLGDGAPGRSADLTNSEITDEEAAQAQTQRHLAELRTFWNISQAISLETDLTPLFEMIHRQLEQALGKLNSFTIALYEPGKDDDSEGTIRIPYAIEDDRRLKFEPYPLGKGFESIIIRTRKPLLLAEQVEEQAQSLGAKILGSPAQSWLGAPMIYAGEVIGAIIVQDLVKENRFNDDDERLLSALAAQSAVVVRNARLLEVARKQARQERMMNEITSRIHRASDIQSILKTTAHELGVALGARKAHIQLSADLLEDGAGMEVEP